MHQHQKVVFLCLCFLVALSTVEAQAQTVEDGLRLSQRNGLYTARMGALGISYNGVADDFAALYVNPAGLTLLPTNEATMGLQFNTSKTTTDYLATTTPWTTNNVILSHLGVVIPIRSRAGNFSIAFGYSRDNDFNETDTIVGFNTTSSLVQSWVQNQRGTDLSNNRAWRLLLADTVNGRFISPIVGNVAQGVFTKQSGSIGTYSGGIGVDVSQSISVGASIMVMSGSYTYERQFSETDTKNVYNRLDPVNFTNIDFKNYSIRETIRQDISGLRAVLGMQAKIGDDMRLGISVTTPGAYQITDVYQWTGTSTFDNGDIQIAESPTNQITYTIVSPWVFSVGFSGHISGLTLTSGIEYAALQQTEFSTTDPLVKQDAIDALNTEISRVLSSQFRWGVGAEYDLQQLPLVVRGSYSFSASPYQQSAVASSTSIIAFGAGVYLAPNARLDAMYRLSDQSYQVSNYAYNGLISSYQGTKSVGQFALQVVYRF